MSIAFSASDGRYRLRLSDSSLATMLDGGRSSFPRETGGILIGHYTDSLKTAVVERATLPPPDSKRTRTQFYRGVVGLKELLGRLWRRSERERRYYLGEWHFHPGGAPTPSTPDSEQMQEIAESEYYHCPEAILLLLGGDPRESYSLAAWIYRRGEQPLQLGRVS